MPEEDVRVLEYPGEIGLGLQHLGILVGQQAYAKVWPEIANGRIRVVTRHTFPLAEAGKAHALMASSQHVGKIVLLVQ